jgi:hypothetical protein
MAEQALPLDSPNWVPLNAAFRRGNERTGSPDLTVADLKRGLDSGAVSSMLRPVDMSGYNFPKGRPRAPMFPEPVQLRSTFWRDCKLRRQRDGLQVVPVSARLVGSYVFYVWRPDLEAIWPTMEPITGALAASEAGDMAASEAATAEAKPKPKAKPTKPKPKAKPTKAKPKAKPTKAKPRKKGGNRPRFDRDTLKQLVEDNPAYTNKQILKAFGDETGTEPSLKWIETLAPGFRRTAALKRIRRN